MHKCTFAKVGRRQMPCQRGWRPATPTDQEVIQRRKHIRSRWFEATFWQWTCRIGAHGQTSKQYCRRDLCWPVVHVLSLERFTDGFRYRVSIHRLKSFNRNKSIGAGIMVETNGALTTPSKPSNEKVTLVNINT